MMPLTMSRCQNVEETSHAESGAQNKQKVDSLPNFHKIGICFVNFLPDEFSQCFICSTSLSLNSNVDKCVNQRERE